MTDENILLLDDADKPVLVEDECDEMQKIFRDFIDCYVKNKDKKTEEWLYKKLQEELPDKKAEEIQEMAAEIITAINIDEEKKTSLTKAVAAGRSKESWFASEVKKAASGMSAQESAVYLQNLDDALRNANTALYRDTILTKANQVSRNPNLDGYIAEQYHAQTFNMNAEAAGSKYRAKVLQPESGGYRKNSVDIVIVDTETGKIVKRYQSKYCKNAQATQAAFEKGDYRGQQKLVPEDQAAEMSQKSTSVLEAPDGTTSNPLTKDRAQQMRDEAQSGKWNDLNWGEYRMKDLSVGVAKQAGYAAVQGAVIGAGFNVAQKLWNGEEIDGQEVVGSALTSGADFGIKAAAAGALKVGAEKEIIKIIPKGTPAGTLANIAFVAVENVKVLGKIATGELSGKEGLEKMEQTTVAAVAGLSAMAEGTAIGAAVGTVLGPVGSAIGGFIGGILGYMAGSKIGETVVKGVQKVRETARNVVSSVVSGIADAATSIVGGVFDFLDSFI